MKEIKRGKQIGNKGSTLIVVLVSVVFMTVLGTIIVAVSTANLQMKFQEYASKRNFYTDERVLEDIYHGIGKVANEHLAASYRDVLTQTVTSPDSGGTDVYADAGEYDSQEAAFNDFSRGFVRRLISVYGDDETNLPATLETLQSYIAEAAPGIGGDPDKPSVYVASLGKIDIIDIKEGAVKKDDITPLVTPPENLKVPYQYIFRDVKVVYRDTDSAGRESGYETTITTDIVIEVPYVNFFQDSSRILDYAMIANRGIYISSADRSIVGNVYAGIGRAEDDPEVERYDILRRFHGIGDTAVNADIGVYGGLNILDSDCLFSSNYLISKGDINVRGSKLALRSDLSAAGGQVWAESIRTVAKENLRQEPAGYSSSAVAAEDVSFYVANDLELNENGSSFLMTRGNYYGYNAGNYDTWEAKGTLSGKYSSLNHAENSAVILNGIGTSVNLAGEVVINGVAYMDLASRPAGSSYSPLQSNTGEYPTGESLAFKSNQYIYLAPSDNLSTTNPVINPLSADRPADPALDNPWISSVETDNWFGCYANDTVEAYVEKGDPLIVEDVIDRLSPSAPTYRFYFLKIKPGMAAKFAGLVMNMPGDSARITAIKDNEMSTYQALFDYYHYGDYSSDQQDQIWELKQALSKRLSAAGSKAQDTYSRLYAQGAFPSYDGTDLAAEDKLLPDDKQLSLEYAGKLESDYHKRYVSLYQKLDPLEGSRLETMGNAAGGNYADLASDLAPVDLFVNFTTLAAAPGSVSRKWDRYRNTYESLISSGDIVLPASEGDFNGIIICMGDVTVKPDVNVKGLIIAGGKIIVEGNGYIEGNRGIVQEILDEEIELDSARPLDIHGNKPLKRADYVTTYLTEIKVNYSATDKTERVRGTDYTQYMSYDNWRKG